MGSVVEAETPGPAAWVQALASHRALGDLKGVCPPKGAAPLRLLVPLGSSEFLREALSLDVYVECSHL